MRLTDMNREPVKLILTILQSRYRTVSLKELYVWNIFRQEKQKKEAAALITGEKLNEEAAKRYIQTSLKRKYASENGADLNAILPKMSPLNPQYLTKKQSVFQKIVAFIEKFRDIGGQI